MQKICGQTLITCQELMTVAVQSEFPLRVAVCAWCKPKKRSADPGKSLGSISHGICPRHFKKMKQELSMKKVPDHPAHAIAAPSRRRRSPLSHPELNYQA